MTTRWSAPREQVARCTAQDGLGWGRGTTLEGGWSCGGASSPPARGTTPPRAPARMARAEHLRALHRHQLAERPRADPGRDHFRAIRKALAARAGLKPRTSASQEPRFLARCSRTMAWGEASSPMCTTSCRSTREDREHRETEVCSAFPDVAEGPSRGRTSPGPKAAPTPHLAGTTSGIPRRPPLMNVLE